jgi:hydroxyacylglutathione hydrolase
MNHLTRPHPERLMRFPLASLLCLCACATTSVTRGAVTVRTFTHDSMNAHLVTENGQSFLFDAGLEAHGPLLEAELREAGVDPKTLKAIIVSHGHADHAGGAGYLHRKFGVPVIAGDGDQGMLTSGKNEKLCPQGFIARSRVETDQNATYRPFAADELIRSPQSLKERVGFEAQVTPLPGHTKGSLVVTVGEFALVGDLLRGSIIGAGAETHFYQCDLEENRRGVAQVLTSIAPDAKLFFVGHFGPIERGEVAAHFGVGP